MSTTEVRPGDVVIIDGEGIGVVRFFGKVEFSKEKQIGVELASYNNSKSYVFTDGTVKGKRYFKCPNKNGVFVTKVKKVVTAANLLTKLIDLYEDNKVLTVGLTKKNFEIERLVYQADMVAKKFGQSWEDLVMTTRSNMTSPSSFLESGSLTAAEQSFFNSIDDSDDE